MGFFWYNFYMDDAQKQALNALEANLPAKLLKPYDPAETEGRIYQTWEDSGLFNPDVCIEQGVTKPDAQPYTIIMPPPNANGRLHVGHGLTFTLEDIFTRFHRMNGYRTLWVPGADHAGFETQIVYEKKLEKEGRSRFDIDPADLYKQIYDFTIESKKFMEADVRRLGASCDWSREKFTLDPSVVSAAQQTFDKMFKDGLIYRGERIVNWCSKHQTSLSEVETEFIEKNDPFYYLQYGPFVIATARPETKFGDKYVVMHPNDARYAQYEHGQKITVEWINGPIEATIIKDESIDMELGTGVMTITPWHSNVDFDIAEKYNLDKEQIIDWKGKLLPIAGEFAGIHISKARPLIVEKLKEKGLLVKIDTEYKHNIKVCYKCETTIEPQIKDQWFVKMAPLAKMALDAVQSGKINFYPDNYAKIFKYWMENNIDWNISRQIIWGIPIPAKICTVCKRGYSDLSDSLTKCDCGGQLYKDTDTFDTWFSSGQWTLLALGYPNSPDANIYHPTSLMESGRDLIFKWIPRMVIFGLYLKNEVPFKDVYLHGMVNDEKGHKMSKSKGNVISPIEIADMYGADALRMGMIVGNTPGTDLALSKDKIKGYKLFANKIWNITRFVLTNTQTLNDGSKLNTADEQVYTEWHNELEKITNNIKNYQIHLASDSIYHFIWDTFASKILEESKPLLNSDDELVKQSRMLLLQKLLQESLITLHPFMPFITEEIWSFLPTNDLESKKLLMVTPWPITAIKQ